MHPDFGYFEETKLGKPYDIKLLKRLYPYTRAYRALLFWSIGLVLLITALDLSLPYVTKIAIDHYIVPQMALEADDAGSDSEKQAKPLTVELQNPAKRRLVEKYRHLFGIEGQTASIPYASLSQVEPSDLAELRRNDLRGLGIVSAIFLSLVIINFGLNFVQKMIMEFTGHRIMHDLRMRLYTHIQNLAVEFFTRNPVARLVTRATNDVQNMHELFTSVISLIFKDLFLLFGIALVMLILNWKVALVSFIVLPLVIYASLNFSKRARHIFRLLRIKVAEINTRFSETIGGIRIIQLFRQEVHNYGRFKSLNHENFEIGMQQIHVLAVFMPLIELLGVVAVALIVYYGGSRVLSGTLSLGELVAFITYIRMFFRPIRDLAEKYNILQNAMASAERIFLILDTQNPLQKSQVRSTKDSLNVEQITEIKFERVSFSYVENEPVLKDISFAIKAGQTVAVVGPTGAGKTSLINLLPRFYDPGEGSVRINGHDLKDLDTSAFRSKMALVMQDPFLFSGTIRENVFNGAQSISEDRAHQIMEAANCKALIDRLPNGLETILSEGGASISSGERQLISIARAFARDPQLILFDEATSYIDSQTELQIQQAVANLMAARTSLVVAHRLSTVKSADRIIVLNRGRIIESGNHAELMNRAGFYYRLQQLQNGL
jgi:ATP-binding cassette subfamily B protein